MENWWAVAMAGIGGWVAGQFGNVISGWVRRWHLKGHIVSELAQLYEETERIWLSYARALQLHALGGVDNSHPLPLSNKVYEGHYTDAVLVFTRVQRTAIEMIHSYIAQVNEGIAALRQRNHELLDASRAGEDIGPALGAYGSRMQALMTTTALARWMIAYYLRHPDFPELRRDGEELEQYRKYADGVQDELRNIIASVKGLSPKDFERYSTPSPPPGPVPMNRKGP